jgi:hypothetical protein
MVQLEKKIYTSEISLSQLEWKRHKWVEECFKINLDRLDLYLRCTSYIRGWKVVYLLDHFKSFQADLPQYQQVERAGLEGS